MVKTPSQISRTTANLRIKFLQETSFKDYVHLGIQSTFAGCYLDKQTTDVWSYEVISMELSSSTIPFLSFAQRAFF